ncbi:MAG: hypothetical protein NVS3B20_22020 [Polyangiales bacterium]
MEKLPDIAMTSPTDVVGIAPADPLEMARRGLWHDVRSVLAAATTNVEYIAALGKLSAEGIEVAREIENELRFVMAVIELVTSQRSPDTVVEIDLRSIFWLARRSGGRLLVNATLPAFLVRGAFGDILAFAQTLEGCVPKGNTAGVEGNADVLQVRDLDQQLASRAIVAQLAQKIPLGIQLTESGDLVLSRPR